MTWNLMEKHEVGTALLGHRADVLQMSRRPPKVRGRPTLCIFVPQCVRAEDHVEFEQTPTTQPHDQDPQR